MKITGKVIVNGVVQKNQVVNQAIEDITAALVGKTSLRSITNGALLDSTDFLANKEDLQFVDVSNYIAYGTTMSISGSDAGMTLLNASEGQIIYELEVPDDCGNFDADGVPTTSTPKMGIILFTGGDVLQNVYVAGTPNTARYSPLGTECLFSILYFDEPYHVNDSEPFRIRWEINIEN